MSQSLDDTENDLALLKKKRTEDLFEAIKQGDEEEILNLLKQGVFLETVNENGDTPLLYAINTYINKSYTKEERVKKHENMVKMLVEFEANIEHQNIDGHTPLLCTILPRNNTDVFLFGVAKFLIQKGANINVCDKGGYSLLLHYASRFSQTFGVSTEKIQLFEQMIYLVIAKGANVNQRLQEEYGTSGVYEHLIRNNGDSLYDRDPSRYRKLIDTLFKAGLNPNFVTTLKKNILLLILQHHHYRCNSNFIHDMVLLLVKHGVDLHHIDSNGDSPVQCIADPIKSYLTPIPVKTLEFIMNRVSLDTPLNKYDDNVFRLAARYGQIAMLQILIARNEKDKRLVKQQDINEAFLKLGPSSQYIETSEFEASTTVKTAIFGNPKDSFSQFLSENDEHLNVQQRQREPILTTVRWFLQHVDSKIIAQKLTEQYSIYFLRPGLDRTQALMSRTTRIGEASVLLEIIISRLLVTELISRAQIEYLVQRTEEDLFLKPKDTDVFSKFLSERFSPLTSVTVCFKPEKPFLLYQLFASHPKNKFKFSNLLLPVELKSRIIAFLEKGPHSHEMQDKQQLLIEKRLTWMEELVAKKDREKEPDKGDEESPTSKP